MKYIDKMLIASGVTLLLTGGVAAAALTPTSADAVITQLPGDVAIFASNGPFGSPNILATAATYIGITEADLRTKLQAGQTLAQIATAAGKTRDGLIAALVADGNTKIEAALAAGKITAAQATAQKASLTTRVTAQVDATRPAGGPGFPGRGPRP